MGLRSRNGKLEYRFQFGGESVQCQTGLDDTPANRKNALAMEREHRLTLRLEAGRRPVAVRKPFSEAKEEFKKWCEVEYRAHPESAKRILVSMTSAAEYFSGRLVGSLDAADIESYGHWRLMKLGCQAVTVRHDYYSLSIFFQWAIKRGYHTSNPIREVRVPSDKEAVRQYVLTDQDERRYFQAASANKNLYDAARLILLQGFRPGEVVALLKADCDLTNRHVTVRTGKTPAARRTLFLLTESVEIIRRRLASAGPWLFPSPGNAARHLLRLNGSHQRVLDQTGLGFCLHDLRHTFATRMKDISDPFALAHLLGHSSTHVLKRYVHPTQRHQDDAMRKMERRIIHGKDKGKGHKNRGRPPAADS